MLSESWADLATRAYGRLQGRRREVRDWSELPRDDADVIRRVLLEDPSYVPGVAVSPIATWRVYRASTGATPGATPGAAVTVFCPDRRRLEALRPFLEAVLLPLLAATLELLREELRLRSGSIAPFTFAFVPAGGRRRLPVRPRAPVLPDHINGGVTFGRERLVAVLRKEDACKVLVHELVHLAGLDSPIRPHALPPDLEPALAKRYDVQQTLGETLGKFDQRAEAVHELRRRPPPPLGIAEAYTETLACFLYSVWLQSVGLAQGAVGSVGAVGAVGAVGDVEGIASVLAGRIERIGTDVAAHFGRGRGKGRGRGDRRRLLHVREGTHCFAYVFCRAALWRPPFLRRFLVDLYPPGSPPGSSDASGFLQLLVEALDAWTARPARTPSAAAAAAKTGPKAIGLCARGKPY
jgi:hypothetical protein